MIGNVFRLVLNLTLIGLWVRVISLPYHLLYSAVLVFCGIGVVSHGIQLMALFGLLGYVLLKLGCGTGAYAAQLPWTDDGGISASRTALVAW